LTVNSNCRRMFGFSESELVGQNVSMLMPPFYAAQHDTFLHNYMTSGVAKVMGTIRRTEAKHKDGHTFPIDLAVNRVDTPQGTTFAGVIHAVPEDETAGLVSITDRGIVISCNMVFARMFGWTVPEAINENIKRFMPREYAKHHDSYLARFKRTRQSKIMNLRGRRLQGLHRNGMVFPVSVEVEAAQLNGSTIFNGRITELAAANGVITIDEKGIVQSCNKAMLSLFGFAAQNDVVGRNVNRLMPEPYATFHDQYLARYVATGTGIIVGAVGRYVTGKHFDGTPFPVFLKVTEIKAKGKHGKRMFGGELSLAQVHAEVMKEGGVVDDVGMGADAHGVDAGADTAEVDPQLGRITINAEGRILYVNSVLPAMFGYTEADLKGENVKKLMPDEIAAQHDHFLRVH
ncbi:MAG: PAS domain S-box protein, partial [Methanosarcinales archaeon]